MNSRCALAHYSLSRGAPSATWVLLHVDGLICPSFLMAGMWRRERDSNPRYLSVSLVFKTSAINRSAISPCARTSEGYYNRLFEPSQREKWAFWGSMRVISALMGDLV